MGASVDYETGFSVTVNVTVNHNLYCYILWVTVQPSGFTVTSMGLFFGSAVDKRGESVLFLNQT